jgi:hypothetical protein
MRCPGPFSSHGHVEVEHAVADLGRRLGLAPADHAHQLLGGAVEVVLLRSAVLAVEEADGALDPARCRDVLADREGVAEVLDLRNAEALCSCLARTAASMAPPRPDPRMATSNLSSVRTDSMTVSPPEMAADRAAPKAMRTSCASSAPGGVKRDREPHNGGSAW